MIVFHENSDMKHCSLIRKLTKYITFLFKILLTVARGGFAKLSVTYFDNSSTFNQYFNVCSSPINLDIQQKTASFYRISVILNIIILNILTCLFWVYIYTRLIWVFFQIWWVFFLLTITSEWSEIGHSFNDALYRTEHL